MNVLIVQFKAKKEFLIFIPLNSLRKFNWTENKRLGLTDFRLGKLK